MRTLLFSRCALSTMLFLSSGCGLGQSTPIDTQTPVPSIRSSSTLVIVPTLVRSSEGDLVQGLAATDFRLTDNGVAQEVHLEDAERQPLSLVVLMQTGGAAERQFANYASLGTMVDYLTGKSAYRVAMVTFDSRPEDIWDFTKQSDDLRDGFLHPVPGDGQARPRLWMPSITGSACWSMSPPPPAACCWS